jgi:D-alanyl-D-alanine dipeptidase
MASNGRLPSSQLAPIPGSSTRSGGHPLLRKDAARAYAALHHYALKRWGISMALAEGAIRRAYREFTAQLAARKMWCAQGKCGNAAVPGTSNHGLGITVDLMTRRQRWVVDQVGHLFGFSKRWSDAPNEWWHIKYRSGSYSWVRKYAGSSSTLPMLRRGVKGPSVVRLKKALYGAGYRNFSGRKNSNRYDPFFSVYTEMAVKRFQRRNHLTADGAVGSSTWRKLGVR